MRKLNKHLLEFESVWHFFTNAMEDVNTLSMCLLKNLDFKTGQFFTLLPDCANLNHITDLSNGGILLRAKQEKIKVLGKVYTGEVINNIKTEVCCLINKTLSKNDDFRCVFDDYNSSGKLSVNVSDVDRDVVYFYNKEVYYILSKKESSENLLLNCMRKSNAFWHSLCIIAKCNIGDVVDRKLKIEDFEQFCLGIRFVIIGAYDGEGFLFWEPTRT